MNNAATNAARTEYKRIANIVIKTFGVDATRFNSYAKGAHAEYVDGEDDNTTPEHWVGFAHCAAYEIALDAKRGLSKADFARKYGEVGTTILTPGGRI